MRLHAKKTFKWANIYTNTFTLTKNRRYRTYKNKIPVNAEREIDITRVVAREAATSAGVTALPSLGDIMIDV